VVDISGVVHSSYTPQLVMESIIDDFDKLRLQLEKMAQTARRSRPSRVVAWAAGGSPDVAQVRL
jgi:hypothetical protein